MDMEDRVVEYLRQAGKGLDWFVETGTADGYTSNALKDDFKHVVTIELDHDRYKHVSTSLFLGTNVMPLWGDSADVLARVVYYLDKPALFWLDAHYSGGVRGNIDTPIEAELRIVFDSPYPHVVLIDDARLFGTDPAYPNIEWVERMAAGREWDYNVTVDDDVIRIIPSKL